MLDLNNPIPTISFLSPSSITSDSVAFTLTVNGTNFINGSEIFFNNIEKQTVYVSKSVLTCTINPTDIDSNTVTYNRDKKLLNTSISVFVRNPSPGGGDSNYVEFVVNDPDKTITKFSLWSNGVQLRGANIYQRRVYIELDGNSFMGSDYVGPPYIQEDFDRLAAMGANYVNISHPGLYNEVPPYGLNEEIQKNLDKLLEMIKKADMFAVISFRTGPGRSEFTFFWGEHGDWFTKSYYNEDVWSIQNVQNAWSSMWKYTANRYKNSGIIVGYDLMCEPNSNDTIYDEWDPDQFYNKYKNTLADWNRMYPDIVKTIREEDLITPIIVGGNAYSSVEWLPYLITVDGSNIVYAIHQYAPFKYTHQESGDNYTYPGTYDIDEDGVKDNFNKQWLTNLFSIASNFSSNNNKIPITSNECGLNRWVPNGDKFMDDQLDLFESMGVNYAIWMWNPEWEEWNEENDSMDIMHGPDPDNHKNISSSKLITIIRKYWDKNTLTPSGISFKK